MLTEGKSGKDLVLTIDIQLQKAVEKIIEKNLKSAKQRGGTELLDRAFVVMMDPRNGEVLSIAGKQITNKNGTYKFDDYALGTMTSSYAMGSAVKGATVLTGYKTGVLHIGSTQYDEPLYIAQSPPKNPIKIWDSLMI